MPEGYFSWLRGRGRKYKLRMEALELEERAKIAKNKGNYEEAAKFHRSAAKFYHKIGDEKNSKWNLANYHLIMGTYYSHSNEFDKARKHLKRAEGLFLELNLREPAFTCSSVYLRTFVFEEKLKQEKIPSQEYFEEAALFFERYKDFRVHKFYISNKIDFFKRKSIKYRLKGDYELAELFTKLCYELAKQAYDKFKEEKFRNAALFNEHMYWNLRAKRLKAEEKFEEAARCYKKSAEIASKIDRKVAIDELVNHYKCLAIANKFNKEVFEEYIDKAIELAEENKDEVTKYYLIGFKYDHFVNFTKSIEEKIEFLKRAKENYYRANQKNLGKAMEFVLFYYLSKKELRDGNYGRSISFLDKAMSCAKYAKFPNIISSPEVLENERYLHEAYLHLSRAEFSDASKSLDNWLDLSKELENTKRYKFYEGLKYCCLMLDKRNFTEDDLLNTEKVLQSVEKMDELHRILSLIYSLISLQIHNIGDKRLMERIKLEVTRIITTEKCAKDLELRLKIQRAVEERGWLLRLPPIFAEKFDQCLYLLENVLEEFRDTAYREFYVLLENFLKIVVEFNAKVLWSDAWKTELEAYITNNKKPFDKFTYGDLVKSLNFLRDKVNFLKDVPSNTFDLLIKHVEIRNNLSHELIVKLSGLNIVEDISKTMFSLLKAFPTCIKVINTKRKPWYDVEIIWNLLPRRITLYSDKELKKGYYYAEPMPEILENELYPELLIESSLLDLLERKVK